MSPEPARRPWWVRAPRRARQRVRVWRGSSRQAHIQRRGFVAADADGGAIGGEPLLADFDLVRAGAELEQQWPWSVRSGPLFAVDEDRGVAGLDPHGERAELRLRLPIARGFCRPALHGRGVRIRLRPRLAPRALRERLHRVVDFQCRTGPEQDLLLDGAIAIEVE